MQEEHSKEMNPEILGEFSQKMNHRILEMQEESAKGMKPKILEELSKEMNQEK